MERTGVRSLRLIFFIISSNFQLTNTKNKKKLFIKSKLNIVYWACRSMSIENWTLKIVNSLHQHHLPHLSINWDIPFSYHFYPIQIYSACYRISQRNGLGYNGTDRNIAERTGVRSLRLFLFIISSNCQMTDAREKINLFIDSAIQ